MLKSGYDLVAGFGTPVVMAEVGLLRRESYVTDRIEAPQQPIEGTRPDQLLTEQPDGLGVRHRIMQRQTGKAHERQPVAQLVLRR